MSSGDQELFMTLMNGALTSTSELSTYWSVQHKHPDGHRWFDVAHYLTRDDAEAAVTRCASAPPATSFA